MKYLLQADWLRLVRDAERYRALQNLYRIETGDHAELIDAKADAELERQADASRRASGDSDCKACGRAYRLHPKGGPIGYGDEQFLNRLCDGSLVKL